MLLIILRYLANVPGAMVAKILLTGLAATGLTAMMAAPCPDTFQVEFTRTVNNGAQVLINVTRAWAPLGADHFYELVKTVHVSFVLFCSTPNVRFILALRRVISEFPMLLPMFVVCGFFPVGPNLFL